MAWEDVEILTSLQEIDQALWAILAVWVNVSREQECLNTIMTIMHNILIGVLDRLGDPVQDQEGPLMVD